ncbi:MAG: hypothetical protein KIS92_06230 [Planctomycetota bacterium]|nr:hypothetical protein [Planctomycetota bacterium]
MSDPGSTTQLPAVKAAAKGSGLTLGVLLLLASPVLVAGVLTQPFLNLNGSELAALTAKSDAASRSLAPLSDALLRFQLGVSDNPALVRLLGLVFHFASAMLLYSVLRAWMPVSGRNVVGPGFTIIPSLHPTKNHLAAGLAAAWFFFHPTNVESLVLGAQRANVQALFFCLLALWALYRPATGAAIGAFFEPPDVLRFLAGLVAFAAAIFSSIYAVALTPLLVLAEACLVRGALPGRMVRGGMLGAAGVLLGVKTLSVLPSAALAPADPLTVLACLGQGLRTILLPWPLSYQYVAPQPVGIGDPSVLLGLGLIALLAAVFVLLPLEFRRTLVLATGLVCVLGFGVWLRGRDGYQDHRVYMALPFAAGLLALSIEALQYRCNFVLEAAQLGVRRFSMFVGFVGCMFLGWLSFGRSYDFADGETLYRHAAEAQPSSYRANAGLAKLLLAGGQAQLVKSSMDAPKTLDEAARFAREALAADDKEVSAANPAEMRYVEACVAFLLDRTDAADKARAIVSLPGNGMEAEKAGALRILADLSRKAYAAKKDPKHLEEAVGYLRQELALNKNDGEARLALAEMLEVLHRNDDAVLELKLLAGDPGVGARAKASLERLAQKPVVPAPDPVAAAAVSDPKELPLPKAPIQPGEAKVALVILLRGASGKLKEQGLNNLLKGDYVKNESDGTFSFGDWKCDPGSNTFTAAIPDGDTSFKVTGIFRTRADHLRAFILGDKPD